MCLINVPNVSPPGDMFNKCLKCFPQGVDAPQLQALPRIQVLHPPPQCQPRQEVANTFKRTDFQSENRLMSTVVLQTRSSSKNIFQPRQEVAKTFKLSDFQSENRLMSTVVFLDKKLVQKYLCFNRCYERYIWHRTSIRRIILNAFLIEMLIN